MHSRRRRRRQKYPIDLDCGPIARNERQSQTLVCSEEFIHRYMIMMIGLWDSVIYGSKLGVLIHYPVSGRVSIPEKVNRG